MRSTIITVAVLILMGVGYVLSYAPVYRIFNWRCSPAYKPVEWLIDQTPLHEPLLRWSAVWGVRYDMGVDAFLRDIQRKRPLGLP